VHESIIRLPPPTCIARTIAILLHVYSTVYDAPPTHLLHAIRHTVLAMAISCKGQGVYDVATPLSLRPVSSVLGCSSSGFLYWLSEGPPAAGSTQNRLGAVRTYRRNSGRSDQTMMISLPLQNT